MSGPNRLQSRLNPIRGYLVTMDPLAARPANDDDGTRLAVDDD